MLQCSTLELFLEAALFASFSGDFFLKLANPALQYTLLHRDHAERQQCYDHIWPKGTESITKQIHVNETLLLLQCCIVDNE